jgi:hypothetical protein
MPMKKAKLAEAKTPRDVRRRQVLVFYLWWKSKESDNVRERIYSQVIDKERHGATKRGLTECVSHINSPTGTWWRWRSHRHSRITIICAKSQLQYGKFTRKEACAEKDRTYGQDNQDVAWKKTLILMNPSERRTITNHWCLQIVIILAHFEMLSSCDMVKPLKYSFKSHCLLCSKD